jgi:hypothetical protein
MDASELNSARPRLDTEQAGERYTVYRPFIHGLLAGQMRCLVLHRQLRSCARSRLICSMKGTRVKTCRRRSHEEEVRSRSRSMNMQLLRILSHLCGGLGCSSSVPAADATNTLLPFALAATIWSTPVYICACKCMEDSSTQVSDHLSASCGHMG